MLIENLNASIESEFDENDNVRTCGFLFDNNRNVYFTLYEDGTVTNAGNKSATYEEIKAVQHRFTTMYTTSLAGLLRMMRRSTKEFTEDKPYLRYCNMHWRLPENSYSDAERYNAIAQTYEICRACNDYTKFDEIADFYLMMNHATLCACI